MSRELITRDSDGLTVDLAKEEAEHADTTANAKRVVLVNTSGTATGDKVKITDGTYDAEVDVLGYLVAIEIEHHKVHEGKFYTVSDYDSSVDTASPKYWHIITPDSSARAHIKIQVATDTGGLIEFYENPTTTNNGGALTAFNNDRNSGNSTTFNFYKDPTISSDGTLIEVSRIGAGREKKIGGMARQPSEIILKQNEQYLIKATPDSNGASVTINIGFYEV